MLILTTTHLHITLDHLLIIYIFILFYSPYISACDLVVAAACLWFQEG